jgi:adenylosuccinate synthase
MPAVVVVGAQWGDEGKGKIVDLLSENVDVVVRFAGGPNAGHTLVVGEERLVFRLVPSGVLHRHIECVLGPGMVINAEALLGEIGELEQRKIEVRNRMCISDRAHLIMPYHIAIDGLREAKASGTKIGTTKRGIGPCYEDKVGRRGLRTGDLLDLAGARARIAEALAFWAPQFRAMDQDVPPLDAICAPLDDLARQLGPLIGDTSPVIDKHIVSGQRVLLEGAQGTMLDIDHGTYPFVTSSSAIAGGACTGAGVGPSRISHVLGITKAYATRVGGGPFPTELDDASGAHLRDKGHEFGSVTGRPRRAGWLDLAALRYARQVNGLDSIAITKLDVLAGMETIKTCIGYDTPSGRRESMPIGSHDGLTPVYQEHPGWEQDISGCREYDQLPQAARDFLSFVSDESGLRIDLISVGPRRGDTIVVRDPFG